jgi:F0F1-type ATP synthase membrane subunit b/b'
MAAENERLKKQTEAALEKIRRQAEQEIEGAAKAARHEVRSFAAGLAAELAARRLRASLDEAADDALVGSFLEEMKKSRGSAPKELN